MLPLKWDQAHTPFFRSHPHRKAFGRLPPSQPRRLLPLLLSIDFKLLLLWGSALPAQSWGYDWTWHPQHRFMLPWHYHQAESEYPFWIPNSKSQERKDDLHSMVEVPSWLTQGWKVVQGQIVQTATGANVSRFGISIIIREQSWVVPKMYLPWNDTPKGWALLRGL